MKLRNAALALGIDYESQGEGSIDFGPVIIFTCQESSLEEEA